MARMRPAGALVVAPGTTVTAEPGGLHLMLVDLKSPLVAGTSIPLVLEFKSAGAITVQLQVEPQVRFSPLIAGHRHETVRMLSARRDRRLTAGICRRWR